MAVWVLELIETWLGLSLEQRVFGTKSFGQGLDNSVEMLFYNGIRY